MTLSSRKHKSVFLFAVAASLTAAAETSPIVSFVLSLGASAAGNRAAIQRAVDAASARGGGVVTIPAGEWPCGSVRLRSHVELRLEAGAVLKGSCDPRDYNADDAFEGNFFCRVEQWGGAHLLFAADRAEKIQQHSHVRRFVRVRVFLGFHLF